MVSSGEIENTSTRILDATRRLLERPKASAVRMSDIAKAAGLSRQAVYLHFPTRAELLIATTKHIDQANGIDARLAASRAAATGLARLDAFIEAWGNYIPVIHPVAKAIMAMRDRDEAAAAAWANRMQAVHEGCAAAVSALEHDGMLNRNFTPAEAADLLLAMLSVETWETLTLSRGWPQSRYIAVTQIMARQTLAVDAPGG